jgi:hypothetical protein
MLETQYQERTPRSGAAYFSSVSFFPDLPHVHLEDKQHVSKALLTALGVRDRVSLALVFERIDTLKWDTYALVCVCNAMAGRDGLV